MTVTAAPATAPPPEATADAATAVATTPAAPGPTLWVAATLVGILVVVAVFSWLAYDAYRHTEDDLLRLRAEDAAALFPTATTAVQTELEAGAEVVAATDDTARFDQLMADHVGPHRSFVGVSLWRLTSGGAQLLTAEGKPLLLAGQPGTLAAFLRAHDQSDVLGVSPLMHSGDMLRIGYAVAATPTTTGLVAYAEVSLPAGRRLAISASSPFADLHYAIYLGRRTDRADLLATDLSSLPPTVAYATVDAPFGSSSITLVVTAKSPLAGQLLLDLWWIVAVVGGVLAVAAAWGVGRTVRRRQQAEALATALDEVARQNRDLYRQQRTIAHTLQHALLPERLPGVPGLESAARYVAGVAGTEIGGDWYDLVALDDDRALVVVGDVSGRGLRAAAVMASLRFAARAYAAQGDDPETILRRLSTLLDLEQEGHFATVLCAQLDVGTRRMVVASAGHLPPLLLADGTATYVPVVAGLPIGVAPAGDRYVSASVTVPPGATLLAFTDGVVERRGELLDVGLERLRAVAGTLDLHLADFLAGVVDRMGLHLVSDDAAILAVRWCR